MTLINRYLFAALYWTGEPIKDLPMTINLLLRSSTLVPPDLPYRLTRVLTLLIPSLILAFHSLLQKRSISRENWRIEPIFLAFLRGTAQHLITSPSYILVLFSTRRRRHKRMQFECSVRYSSSSHSVVSYLWFPQLFGRREISVCPNLHLNRKITYHYEKHQALFLRIVELNGMHGTWRSYFRFSVLRLG